jgi:methionine synthase II (cobalamin-independent)
LQSTAARLGTIGQQKFEVADNVLPEAISFGELGYAREARVSYQDFCAARERGDFPRYVRFQVSLPTPLAVVGAFMAGPDVQKLMPAYQKAMLREVATICAAIPHGDLCIQWDVAVEMVIWDGQPLIFPPFPNKEHVIPMLLAGLCDAVPADVEVGLHLCYGDLDAKHFIEPIDMGPMVSLANAAAKMANHPLAYVHMPMPISRDDDAYFAPLASLAVDPETEVFLGLVHADAPENSIRRIKAASKYASGFGIATECGIARKRTPEMVRDLLNAHAAVSREPAQ